MLESLKRLLWRLEREIFSEPGEEIKEVEDVTGQAVVIGEAGAEVVERGRDAVEARDVFGPVM